ncbi:MAG: ABC transporter ATP-binding protein, partial [Clostridiales Family XIII bacterium]|nr:ABC transporter ATP-binding protein [Clostridiales Family XIII bacterium]
MRVEVEHLSVSYGPHEVLRDVSFTAAEGECLSVLGPNGVGKSTLFKCLLGLLAARSGRALIEQKPIVGMRRADAAKLIAYIPQSVTPAFNYTVLDTVLMGVANRVPAFQGPSDAHREKAMDILTGLGVAHLCDRGCGRISAGERQLTLLARALVQDARTLVMDEPTANLDYGNSFRVMERVASLAERGYTVIFSTHEPDHALRYAKTVLALKDGAVLSWGAPKSVLTEETLSSLYGIDVCVGTVDAAG